MTSISEIEAIIASSERRGQETSYRKVLYMLLYSVQKDEKLKKEIMKQLHEKDMNINECDLLINKIALDYRILKG